MAKPLSRKAAVAERRAAAAPKSAPPRRPRLANVVPAPAAARVEERTRGATTWLRDIRSEMRKVVWPTREEATKLTTVVIVISVIVGIFLGSVDAIFAALITWLLQ